MSQTSLNGGDGEDGENQVAGFILKTFNILNVKNKILTQFKQKQIQNEQYSKIIYWSSSGKEFVIKDNTKFEQILPKYFRHDKINSFIRQLNMYGFHKSRKEHTKSIFSHQLFIRDRPDLLVKIKRKIRGAKQLQNISTTPRPQDQDDNSEGAAIPQQPLPINPQHTTTIPCSGPSIAEFTLQSSPSISQFEAVQPFSKIHLGISYPQIPMWVPTGRQYQDSLQQSMDEIDPEPQKQPEIRLNPLPFQPPSFFISNDTIPL